MLSYRGMGEKGKILQVTAFNIQLIVLYAPLPHFYTWVRQETGIVVGNL